MKVYSNLPVVGTRNTKAFETKTNFTYILIENSTKTFNIVAGAAAEVREYCLHNNNNVFNATCSHGYVIVMEVARYGRMKPGECVTSDRDLNCYNDELTYMHALCSGRERCELVVPSPVMQGRYPCKDLELHSYLEAAYRCQKGTSDNSKSIA